MLLGANHGSRFIRIHVGIVEKPEFKLKAQNPTHSLVEGLLADLPLLDKIQKAKGGDMQFHVEAVHVRMQNIHYESDTSYLEHFCQQHGVKLHVLSTRFETGLQAANAEEASAGKQPSSAETLRKQKTPCFLCSWYRRKAIFNLAQAENFNKIALGHHQDDILHTTLMNLCFQGRFDGMPVSMPMRRMPLTIIRPLCLEHESDLKAFALLRHYEQQLKSCPYEHETHRAEIAGLYQQIEEMNPEVRYSIWHALQTAGKLVEY